MTPPSNILWMCYMQCGCVYSRDELAQVSHGDRLRYVCPEHGDRIESLSFHCTCGVVDFGYQKYTPKKDLCKKCTVERKRLEEQRLTAGNEERRIPASRQVFLNRRSDCASFEECLTQVTFYGVAKNCNTCSGYVKGELDAGELVMTTPCYDDTGGDVLDFEELDDFDGGESWRPS